MSCRILKIISISTILIFFITSCEHGNEVVNFEITKFPDRIVYEKNIDKKLMLDGMVIESKSRSGNVSKVEYDSSFDSHVVADIDFTTTGVYPVKIIINGCERRFAVQVLEAYRLK